MGRSMQRKESGDRYGRRSDGAPPGPKGPGFHTSPGRMKDLAVNLAYVVDNSLAHDERLDFGKVEYKAVAEVTIDKTVDHLPPPTRRPLDA